MKSDNIFFFKNIVDKVYPDEDRDGTDIQQIVLDVKEKIKLISDDDFCEVITCCFIPDLYKGMGIKEKLFTKLTELMLGDWWRRMGGDYILPTKKSGTEDVEMILGNVSIVCDAKVFRLGRSQKAPNVKDFLKLASVAEWITNLSKSYKKKNIDQKILGGMVSYSSLHEWKSDSEVYRECTNLQTPVVMFPYEVLALLLKYKNNFELEKFLELWEYKKNGVQTSRIKKKYWDYITGFICDLIGITPEKYNEEIAKYRKNILLAVKEYKKLVKGSIDKVSERIKRELDALETVEQIKEYAFSEISRRDNAQAWDYIKHIDDFRSYRDI